MKKKIKRSKLFHSEFVFHTDSKAIQIRWKFAQADLNHNHIIMYNDSYMEVYMKMDLHLAYNN